MNPRMTALTMATVSLFSPAARAVDTEMGTYVTIEAPPLPHQPFTLSEIINPETGRPHAPDDVLRVEVEGQLYFQGVASDFLSLLNEAEQELNAAGRSLRRDGVDLVQAFKSDKGFFDRKKLEDLRLKYSTLGTKLKEAIRDCRLLEIAQLGINVRTGLPFRESDKVELEGGLTLAAREVVGRINEQQKVLCQLGYSMLEDLGTDGVVEALMERRDSLLGELGISKYHRLFNMASLERLADYADLAQDVADVLSARQIPGPEQLHELRTRLNAALPPELELPELPNIPAPTPARRMDLDLKKRKAWDFAQGDRKLAGVYVNTYAEIRGSETAQQMTAEGKAGVYLVGNDANVLYGYANFYGGPDQVKGETWFRVMGIDLHHETVEKTLSWTWNEPRLYELKDEVAYEQEFMVGPIPVGVKIGANYEVWLGAEAGVTLLSAHGSVTPGANAAGFAEALVGSGRFLAIGAGAEIVLLDVRPTLQGNAAVRFDEAGVPYIKLAIDAGVSFETLNGRIYAFAKYPVPRFGLPPWKTKTSEYDIFSWDGYRDTRRIMSWGMDLSPFGSTMHGDLVDQTDRAEADGLNDALQLNQREIALANLKGEVVRKERQTIEGILADLGGDANRRIPLEVDALGTLADGLEQTRQAYLNVLRESAL